MEDFIKEYQKNLVDYHFEYLEAQIVGKEIKQFLHIMYDLFFKSSETKVDQVILIKQRVAGAELVLSHLIKLYGTKDKRELTDQEIENLVKTFFQEMLEVRKYLYYDAEAMYDNDPGCLDKAEIVLAYPGFYALFVYRISHVLYKLNIRIVPRLLSEYAHSRTGIDISAGAIIGKNCSIDHGTGIVIGETTVIHDNVKIYQGVTLGALSTRGGQKLKDTKRHPTIMDNVTIYANATILGGNTVISEGKTIKANAFITESM